MLAIYGAEAFRKSMDGLTQRRSLKQTKGNAARLNAARLLCFIAVLAAAFVIPCVMILLKARPFSRANAEQFQRMEYVLNHTGPKDVVFDGESAYVFRPQAYFYGSLFHAIVWRIQRGEITQDIPQSLIKTDCRWVIYDERVATLPQPVQVFLKANYEASEFPGIYRAKKH